MKTVLGRTPPAGYSRFQPYTLEEIDTHPDAMRLWATLVELADDFERQVEFSYNDGYTDAKVDYDQGFDEGYYQGKEDANL